MSMPQHTAKQAIEQAERSGFEIWPHPPYSPDLAPSDFYLFPKLKQHIQGNKFCTDDELINSVEEFFECQSEDFFWDRLFTQACFYTPYLPSLKVEYLFEGPSL